MKVVSVSQMRQIEQASVEMGVSLDTLQRNAAAVLATEMERLFGPGVTALFVAGPGNNGRDTLIAADMLRGRGWDPRVYLAPRVTSEDVLAPMMDAGVPIHREVGVEDRALLRRWIREAPVVVDGLLGIGGTGPAREPLAGIIAVLREESAAERVKVVAVDLPSGIDADSGAVPGHAVRADYTVSLGCVKAGLLKFPAAELVGQLIPVDIGLPEASYRDVPLELISQGEVKKLLPPRPLNAHKGTFGRVLVVAGSANYVGAAYLAGSAAARAGCGLATLAVPAWQRVPLAALFPEATYLPLREADSEEAAEANILAVEKLLPECSALIVGPGLGQGSLQSRFVLGVLEANERGPHLPVVLDADALNALSGVEGWWGRLDGGAVLTPHPGEMSRLTGLTASEVNSDRWSVAMDAARQWRQVVVLKGAFTVVADPSGRAWVNPSALPALATAGTGDVLTGLVGGLMAQGLGGREAAVAAVAIHSSAGRLALEKNRGDRLLASDLLAAIPPAITQS